MALQDFIVNNGLIVGAANASYVTSSTNNPPGSLQTYGGASVALNLIVGSTASIFGPLIANGIYDNNLIQQGGIIFTDNTSQLIQDSGLSYSLTGAQLNATNINSQVITATSNLYVLGSTDVPGNTSTAAVSIQAGGLYVNQSVQIDSLISASSNSIGALVVAGGAYLGNNLYIANNDSDSTATSGNSIITQGGVGIAQDLFVGNNTVIGGTLTVLGTQTIVNSTSTAITDPVIDLGVGINDTILHGNDGYNKGLVIHYYDTQNNQMFLGRNNTNGYLIVRTNIGSPLINIPNNYYINNGIFATMQLGSLIAENTSSNTTTVAGNTIQITSGGIGVDGPSYFADDVVVAGTIYGVVTRANNINGGAPGQIPIQNSQGSTTFISTGSNGYVLTWDSINNTATWQSVAGSNISNTATNISGGAAWDIPFQIAPGITKFDNTFTYYNTNSNNILSINNIQIYGDGTNKGPGLAGNQIVDRNNQGIELYSTSTTGFSELNYANTTIVKVNNSGVTLGYNNKRVTITNAGTLTSYGLVINNAYTMPTNSGTNGYSLTTNGSGQASWQPSSSILEFTGSNSTGTGTINLITQTLDFISGPGISTVANTQTITITNIGVVSMTAGTDTAISTSTGNITIWNTGTLQSVTSRGNTTTNHIGIFNSLTVYNFVYAEGVGIGSPKFAIPHTYFELGSTNTNAQLPLVVGNYTTGTAASADIVVVNDQGSLGDFGINSSAVTGLGSFYLGNATYLSAGSGDLVLGTFNTNSIHFVINNNSIDAATINTSGVFIINTTINSTSTQSGSLVIAGGVGVGGSLYANNIVSLSTISGTSVIANSGTFSSIQITGTNATLAGTSNGVLLVDGGVNIQKDLYVKTAATFAETITTTNGLASNSGTNVADIMVAGGITIDKDLYVGTTATILGNVFITSTLDSGYIAGTTASNIYYSLATLGGVKSAGNIIAGGVISAGDFDSTGQPYSINNDSGSRDGFFLLNNMQSARTIKGIDNTSTVTIDTWSTATYTTAKYLMQIVDTGYVMAAELLFIQDGSGNVYMTEYGIIDNHGQLGVFNGSIVGPNAIVTFTPSTATNMTIQVVCQKILTIAENYV